MGRKKIKRKDQTVFVAMPTSKRRCHHGCNRHTGSRVSHVLNAVAHLIPGLVGSIIGVMLTVLFALVLLAVVFAALRTESTRSTQLLNSAMALAATAMGGVIGFYFGRRLAR